MDKKVSPQHIERLYKFTREHFVEHFDLQTELVDHLANAIETKWIAQPDMDFETALQQEFKKFGVFGFMEVVEKRQAALTKKYYKLLWNYFREFLRLPRIMLTLAAIEITYQLLIWQPLLYMILLLLILPLSFIKLFQINKRYKAKVKITGRRWLMEDIIFSCGGTGIYIYLIIQFLRLDIDAAASPLIYLLASTFLVLLMLYDYIVLFIIPAKAEDHLKATYPEYNLEFTK